MANIFTSDDWLDFHTTVQRSRKFWNVVLEEDGEDRSDGSREKWVSITKSQGGKEYPENSKKKEG